MLPVAVVVATVAMASGVEGATFFAPLFLLGMGLSPEVAIGTGLITEVFGFASGVTAYVRKRLIDYRLAGTLLVVTVPAALLGSWLTSVFDPEILKAILGTGLFVLAFTFLRPSQSGDGAGTGETATGDEEPKADQSCVVTAEGEEICYTVSNRVEAMAGAGVGAVFMGMIATGLGEMNGYFLLKRCKVPSRVAVATSVLVVAVSALVAAAGHLVGFFRSGGEDLPTVLSLVIWTVPGVIIGGQLGAAVASRISQHALERGLGLLFLLVGGLMLADVLL